MFEQLLNLISAFLLLILLVPLFLWLVYLTVKVSVFAFFVAKSKAERLIKKE